MEGELDDPMPLKANGIWMPRCLDAEQLGSDSASLWTKVGVNLKFEQMILFLCETAVVHIFDNQESLLQWWYIQ